MSLGSVTQKHLDKEFIDVLKLIRGARDPKDREEGFKSLERIVRIYNVKSVSYRLSCELEARLFREGISDYNKLVKKFWK